MRVFFAIFLIFVLPVSFLLGSAFPFETVQGFYYFTDRGLFRSDSRSNRPLQFDEHLSAQGGINFGGRLVFTFDDVIFEPYLDVLMDTLRRYQIKAVFFLTANHMGATPHKTIAKYLERMIAEGHILANHSFSHDTLDRYRFAAGLEALALTRGEFARLEELVDSILGRHYAMEYIRPPFGIRGNGGKTIGERMSLPGRVDQICKDLGKKLVLWHINSTDFLMAYPKTNPEYRSSAQVVHETLTRLGQGSGGIILFHANPRTPAVLTGVCQGLWSDGNVLAKKSSPWKPATVADLLKIKYGTP